MSNYNPRPLGRLGADRPAPPLETMRLGALFVAMAVAIWVGAYHYATGRAGDSVTAARAGVVIEPPVPTTTTIPTVTATPTVLTAPREAEAGAPAAATVAGTEGVEPAFGTERVRIVERGDTLAKIAGRYGVGLGDLIAANRHIAHPSYIEVGQRIRIPD